MEQNELAELYAKRLLEESEHEEACYWMSFCDGERPKGSQFLGVVVMKAKGFAHAIQRSWALGINPGGEIQAYQTDPDAILPEHFDRLLSKDDLIAAGYIDA